MSSLKGINGRIRKQEEMDFYVASRILKESINPSLNIETYPTPDTYYVDLWGISRLPDGDVRFNVEIKERYKDKKHIEKYPTVELRVDKYNRMRSVTDSDTRLYYMVLLNTKTCYLFDLDNPDVWNNVEVRDWEMKRTQFSDDSDTIKVPTFFIPYQNSTYTVDCSSYFRDWYCSPSFFSGNGLDKERKEEGL